MSKRTKSSTPKNGRRTRGSGCVFLHGKKYYVKWVDLAGNRHTESAHTEDYEEALGVLRERTSESQTVTIEAAKERAVARYDGVKLKEDALQRARKEAKEVIKIKEAWDAYEASPKRKKTAGSAHLKNLKCRFGRFVSWVEKNHPDVVELRRVTQDIANEFQATLVDDFKLSNSTYNKYLALFSNIWTVLADKAKITSDPWTKENITRMRKTTNSRQPFTPEELKTIFEKATGEMRTLIFIARYTGLRRGDCISLEWSELDMSQRWLRLRPNKTKESTNVEVELPIHPSLYEVLDAVPVAERNGYVLPVFAEKFLHEKNGKSYIDHTLKKFFTACGIKTTEERDGAKGSKGKVRGKILKGFHSFRHNFVSDGVNAGVPISVMQEVVGHSSNIMTQHYTHADREAKMALMKLPGVSKSDTATVQSSKVAQVLEIIASMTDEEKNEILARIK